jgi:hypothetical protein
MTGKTDSPSFLLRESWKKHKSPNDPDKRLASYYEFYHNYLSEDVKALYLPRLFEQGDTCTSPEEKVRLLREKAEPDCFCTLQENGKLECKLVENIPEDWNEATVNIGKLSRKDSEFVFRNALRYLDSLVFVDPHITASNENAISAINWIIRIWRENLYSRNFADRPPDPVVIITSFGSFDKKEKGAKDLLEKLRRKELDLEVRILKENELDRFLGDAAVQFGEGNSKIGSPTPVWEVKHNFEQIGRLLKVKGEGKKSTNLGASSPNSIETVHGCFKNSMALSPSE